MTPKGTGVICSNPQGIAPHIMVSEYLGEIYPPYRWWVLLLLLLLLQLPCPSPITPLPNPLPFLTPSFVSPVSVPVPYLFVLAPAPQVRETRCGGAGPTDIRSKARPPRLLQHPTGETQVPYSIIIVRHSMYSTLQHIQYVTACAARYSMYRY